MSIDRLGKNRWWALALLCAAQFIVILDTSIIGVALPSIQRALGIAQEDLQWVFNAYVIVFGGLLLLGGRLSDLIGQRRIFMAGFGVLTGASLLAGVADSEGMLFAGRALQGLGAALIAPSALTVVMMLFQDPKELGKALGFWGASAAAGGTAGVFLGGAITEWLSWRWTFLINVPLGLLVLALAPMLLPRGAPRKSSGRQPLVPLRIFRAPNLTAGNLVMALLAAAWIPLWFFLNLYLQQVLGLSALQGGLALLPMTLAIMALMMMATARLVNRFGFKANLVAGLLLLVISLVLFASAPADGNFVAHVLPASLIAALGMSLAYIPATMAAMSGARPEETGLASGLVNTSYQVGSALGLAAMVAVSSSWTSGAGKAALTVGFHAAFVGAAIFAVVAAVVAIVWLRQPRSAGESVVVPMG